MTNEVGPGAKACDAGEIDGPGEVGNGCVLALDFRTRFDPHDIARVLEDVATRFRRGELLVVPSGSGVHFLCAAYGQEDDVRGVLAPTGPISPVDEIGAAVGELNAESNAESNEEKRTDA